MTKKIIAAASISGALILGAGAFTLGAILNTKATADENYKAANGILEELKVGKYYRENGTKDEYIEVYDDGTLKFFGFDYLKEVAELNGIDSSNESEYASFAAFEKDIVDFWNGRNYFWVSESSKIINLDTVPPKSGQLAGKEGYCLSYTDENLILFDDDHIYKFAE